MNYHPNWLLALLGLTCGSCSHVVTMPTKSLTAVPRLELKMLQSPQMTGPCLASLIGPPSEKENCLPWNDNIDGAPSYEKSRRLIFTGAGDNFLYVLDSDTGANVAQIATEGRVVTETLFDTDQGLMLFGTDKGVLAVHDAFSYEKRFSFKVDARIQNDLLFHEGILYFSSGLNTLYAVDTKAGKEAWHLARPLASERLTLSSFSNLVLIEQEATEKVLVAPHPDGYLSIVDVKEGQELQQVVISSNIKNFPDIVAPMIVSGGSLWAASYSSGIVAVDTKSWQIKDKINLAGIQQLNSKGDMLYAASDKALYALAFSGRIVWQNNFSELRTASAEQAFPFKKSDEMGRRVFLGLVSRLLIRDNQLIMASSLGAMGSFNLGNGSLSQVVGNSLGFSPKISFGDSEVLALTRKGTVVRF